MTGRGLGPAVVREFGTKYIFTTATWVRSSLIRPREISAPSARSERPASTLSIQSTSLMRPSNAILFAWIAVT